jgi:hypothetical protein
VLAVLPAISSEAPLPSASVALGARKLRTPTAMHDARRERRKIIDDFIVVSFILYCCITDNPNTPPGFEPLKLSAIFGFA